VAAVRPALKPMLTSVADKTPDPVVSAASGLFHAAQSSCASGAEHDTWTDSHPACL